jgi:DNA-directed RNA polymerase specialized sigma24 family protein
MTRTAAPPARHADTVIARDYERLKPDILRTVRGKLASSGVRFDDADLDAFYNQAWHGVHTKLAHGERVENVNGLLVTIAQRRALDEFRALRAESRVDADVLDGQRVDLDLAARADDHRRLRRFIEGLREQLDGREREAAALCYVQDYTRVEAAAAMGLKPRRMEKLMDGVSKKVGAFVGDIERDEFCDARRSLIKAYALGVLDPEGERHRLAADHLSDCSACRRDVLRMRGIAALTPPAPMLLAALAATGAGGVSGHALLHGGGATAKTFMVAAGAGAAAVATVAAVAISQGGHRALPAPKPTPTVVARATPTPTPAATAAATATTTPAKPRRHRARKARAAAVPTAAATPVPAATAAPVRTALPVAPPAPKPRPKPATDGAGEFELH